ncbi:MAG: polysaccharide pyruvyl transferase family protein [Pseudonocardiaceae bacterium]
MTSYAIAVRRRRPTATGPRVGLFGLLGAGNIGNDGSLEAVLAYLRAEYPDAVLGCLCSGPDQVTARYGVPATPLHWYYSHQRLASGVPAIALKAVGKGLDAIRTLRWVRRFDVVIVPGMGVLEATLPLRPWGFPYALFSLCVAGRLFGTKVALVSVGADVISQPFTRWLVVRAARLAHYRSFRDAVSKDAMQEMGVDTTSDQVYPDLVFALPAPPGVPGATGAVGVGVMAYHGGNDDRRRADEIHTSYVEAMKLFVRWLVDTDRRVRLFTGDLLDESVVKEILCDLRAHRPDLDPARVVAEPVCSLEDLMRQISSVDTVVATRYHNVLCALKLAKPTISISYSAKSDGVMASMGLNDFCQSARAVDVERLIDQFRTLESRGEQLQHSMVERNRANLRRLEHQYAALSASLFPVAEPITAAGAARARSRGVS